MQLSRWLLAVSLAWTAPLATGKSALPTESDGATRAALGSDFTFQGRLMDNGSPANGLFDLEFRLFDDVGTPVGDPNAVALEDVTLTDGLFTVELDFGPAAFDGQNRSLEVGVRPGASTGAYAALAPRQRLTASPHALSLRNLHLETRPGSAFIQAPETQIGTTGDPALVVADSATEVRKGSLGVGTAAPASKLHVVGDQSHLMRIEQTSNLFNPVLELKDGSPGQSLGAAINFLTSTDTVPGQLLYALGAHYLAIRVNSVERMRIDANGRVGVGTTAPGGKLTVTGAEPHLLRIEQTSNNFNPVLELKDASQSQDRAAAINFLTGTDTTPGQIMYAMFSNVLSFRVNNAERMRIDSNGNVGIGITSPLARLHALVSGTAIRGESTSAGGIGVIGFATSATGTTQGVYGESSSTDGTGVYGFADATSGSNKGVHGLSLSTSGTGVFGAASAASGPTSGVYGTTESTSGYGVLGVATAATGTTYGVYGNALSTNGTGVYGKSQAAGVYGEVSSSAGNGVVGKGAATGSNAGVMGVSASSAGKGVWGKATSTTGGAHGVFGESASSTGSGVYGLGSATTGSNAGVTGITSSTTGHGVSGLATATTGLSSGVYGLNLSSSGVAVYGQSTSTTGSTVGVSGESRSTSGGVGVFGAETATTGVNFGVLGRASSVQGRGIQGEAPASTGSTFGVYGSAQSSSGTGVLGVASSGTGSTVGVIGEADSTSGIGVWGHADSASGATRGVLGETYSVSTNAVGVLGAARGQSGVTYGVRGTNSSLTGLAAAFENLTSGATVVRLSKGGTNVGDHLVAELNGSPVFRISALGYVYADHSYNCGQTLESCFNSGFGADLAERIDVTEELEPGDVVSIDPDRREHFLLSRESYSTLVAGVVSTQPGITMANNDLADNDTGERTDHRPLLALAGRVPVKASAENGPIRIGDLLVASSTPGHAMRGGADPPAGSVIGKALEPLESGTGVIKMLVQSR